MKGTVLLFNTESDDGLINSTSDVRFKFSRESWISDSVSKTGDRVDFVADGEFAKEICLDPDYSPQNAAGDSSGQHTRQPPPIQMGRTQEGSANLRRAFGGIGWIDDLTLPLESVPPVPSKVMEENDLPRSKLMAVGLSCLLVCIIAIIIIFNAVPIASQYYDRWDDYTVKQSIERARITAIVAIALYYTACLVFVIYCYTIIYRIWKSVQPFGVRTSPAVAIGFSFVPIFNLYWVFHVYYVWALNFNSKVRRFHPHLPPISTGLALSAPIGAIFSLIISFVPGYGLFGFVGLFFILPFLSSADRRARYLLDGVVDDIGEKNARKSAMFLHFSQLTPLVGFIATIIIWQVNKEKVPGLDEHGRSVANWLISCVVYLIVSAILSAIGLFFIGDGLIIALSVCYMVFPIIGGLKAKKGEVWRYPLAIQFFS